MNSKSIFSGYVELKSLIADLKCFRLEEYAHKLQDKKKLHQVYSELQSYYGKKFTQEMRPDEEIRIINRLWESLDMALQDRETQLEQAILHSEKLQTKYKDLTGVIEKLEAALDMLQTQLNNLTEHYSDQKSSNRSELLAQLDKLEAQIRQKENDIRKTSIMAHSLEEEDYSNVQIFLEQLKRLEQVTIQLLCSINTVRNQPILTSSALTPTTNKIYSKTTSFSKITETKKEQYQNESSLVSPPYSVSDQTSSSSFSTPSQSITTTSSNSSCYKSSTNFKSTTNYYELTSVLTTPSPLISNEYSYSPKSTATVSESFLSNISLNLSKSISLLNKSGIDTANKNLNSICDMDIIDVINDSFNWIRSKQTEVNAIKVKPDLAQIQLDLEFCLKLKTELTHSKTTLETIELLKLNHSESPELTQLVNQLNAEYHSLCTNAKQVKVDLESLSEFIRLVHDELQYLNEMEDVEVNRDWSQPGKLNESELMGHKKEVEDVLGNKKMAYARIIMLAENLIERRHPATDDIRVSE